MQDTKNKFDKKKKIDLIRNVCLSRPVDVSHQEKEKVLEKTSIILIIEKNHDGEIFIVLYSSLTFR